MKKYNNYYLTQNIFSTLVLIITGLIIFMLPMAETKAADHCSDEYYINETLPNGASWDMCWEHRQREGVVLHHIYYAPKNGSRRMVLNQASIAQIHVPYDDNGTRFHDISDYGIGGENILSLTSKECPNGTRHKYSWKYMLCQQVEERGFALKKSKNSTDGHTLVLFSVSPVAAYYYIALWRFMDNGTIEPWMGATGALQRFGDNESSGWRLGEGRVGISHLHNFFWKLDFDLNGTPENDVVEEINFPLVNGKRERITTTFAKEASRKVDPENMRRWRVKDGKTKNDNGHIISYDIVLGETGHQDIGPASEPFTHNDIYVTKQKDYERFASHNPAGGKNLAEYTNDEVVAGQDIVLWTGVTFYHMPRSEDAPHMDAHWSHLQLIPRDWHTSNPLGQTKTYNTTPVVSSIKHQTAKVNDTIKLSIKATDIDNDTLSYSATGLPTGLNINKQTGVISGTLTSAGTNTVQVSVKDSEGSSSTRFTWDIEVVHINKPPKLLPLDNQSGLVGNIIHLPVKATDSDEDSLTYSATDLPPGLNINAENGIISGNLTTAGQFTINLKVSDKISNDTQQFTWSIIAPLANKINSNDIIIDGKLDDWKDQMFFPNDPDDITGENNQIDWMKAAIAHNANTLYLAYNNRENIDPTLITGNYIPKGWQTYLDTDNNLETGYIIGDIGADYLIEGTSIQRYIGTSTSWAWEPKGQAIMAYDGKTSEILFNRSIIRNPDKLRAIFIGKNRIFGGEQKDTYPDTGYFNYALTGNSITNTPPIANKQSISLGSGTSVSVILSANDVDGDSLSYKSTSQPSHGTLSGSAPNLIYTANSDFTGVDSFTFSANDSLTDSQVATISIEVTSKQTGLTLSNYISSDITLDGKASDWEKLTAFPDDTDDTDSVINWKNITLAHTSEKLFFLIRNRNNIDPTHSSGTYLPWGWQTFIDSDKNRITGYSIGGIGADFIIEGSHIMQYIGRGNDWSWKSVDRALIQYDGRLAELGLTRSTLGNPASIRILFRGDNQAFKMDQADLYPNSQDDTTATSRFFEYDLKDVVESEGRPEVFAQTVAVNTGSTAKINLIAIDPDNNHLTYSIVSPPENGTLSGTAPNLTYTPQTDFTGQDSFRFKVNDGSSDSILATVTINVAGAQGGIYSNTVNNITVDGDYDDWSALTSFVDDKDEKEYSENEKNLINWQRAAIAHSENMIYFMYQSHGLISPDNNTGSYINKGWQTFMDTDEDNSTGYKIGNIGADYLLEGAQLLQYEGTGTSWSWNLKATADLQFNANGVEISLTREALEMPNKIRVLFIGESSDYGGGLDSYPENKNAFTYLLNRSENSLTNNTQRPTTNSLTKKVNSNTRSNISLSAESQNTESLSFRIVQQPTHGALEDFTSGNSLTYIPKADYTGEDSFSYIVNNGTYDSSIATVSLTVLKDTPKPESTDSSEPEPSTEPSKGGGGGTLTPDLLLLLILIILLSSRSTYYPKKQKLLAYFVHHTLLK